MDPGPSLQVNVPRRLVVAVSIPACAGAILAAIFIRGPSEVVAVPGGTRLLGLSRGVLTWMSATCSVSNARLGGGRATQPPRPVFSLGECPPDNPRFDGEVVYHLGGIGRIWRHAPDRRTVLGERHMAFALALDEHYLYVGSCNDPRDCRIERLPADGSGRPELMQARIVSLANMEVDGRELFWVARGSPKQECEAEFTSQAQLPFYHCRPPVPPRLMAAPKDQPRVEERVVLTTSTGGAHSSGHGTSTGWERAGSTACPRPAGPSVWCCRRRPFPALPPTATRVYLATDAGISEGRDGEPPRPFVLAGAPPGGLALDARYAYWIDPVNGAIVRRRR